MRLHIGQVSTRNGLIDGVMLRIRSMEEANAGQKAQGNGEKCGQCFHIADSIGACQRLVMGYKLRPSWGELAVLDGNLLYCIPKQRAFHSIFMLCGQTLRSERQ